MLFKMVHHTIARLVLLVIVLGCASGAWAETREVRVPLKDGKLHVPDLSVTVCREIGLPGFSMGGGDIDVYGKKGKLLLEAVNVALGSSGRVAVDGSAVVLRIDTDRFDSRCEQLSRAVRVLAAEMNPAGTDLQSRRWGLFLPDHIDDRRPLAVLIHGIDSDAGMLQPMRKLLQDAGYQVASFCYAGDQPIDDSAASLGKHLAELHAAHPSLRLDIVAHSMGGLVARDYIEGDHYAGGVDRLIMVGTPNAGSGWARLRFILSLEQHYQLWRTNDDWSPSWWFTEGFGEAGRDLTPGSRFLKKMGALPRRAGVRYTIIAGTQNTSCRVSADCFQSMSGWIGGRASTWWGLRQTKHFLSEQALDCRNSTGDDDGVVSLKSAKLAGVSDVVLCPADHIALFVPVDGHAPAAWSTIRARLAEGPAQADGR
jgi:pimeloyl-ACP methyl ester carboxylesterase